MTLWFLEWIRCR